MNTVEEAMKGERYRQTPSIRHCSRKAGRVERVPGCGHGGGDGWGSLLVGGGMKSEERKEHGPDGKKLQG